MPTSYPNLWYKIITILWLSNMIWIAFFQYPYFFHSEDMTEFSDVFKILMGRGKFYEKADNLSNILTKFYRKFMTCLCIGYIVYPVQIILHQMYVGAEEISWQLPIKIEFPWNISTIPSYIITFIAVCLNLFTTLYYVLCLDTFFFGAILHMSACFQDLREMLTETDANLPAGDDGVSLIEDHHSNATRRNMINCVKFHNLSIDFVQKMEEIISSSLFVAYIILIFLICAVLYQASEHMMTNQIMRDLIFVVSALIQLLISTFFGSLITEESEKIAFAVYSTHWYRQPPKLRFYYQLILLRSQRSVQLTALTLINSSLQSFTKVISNSTKAFALLQTIQEKSI
ncbi:odorant receptor 10a-like [Lutzomyia longipalpis]|uniref:odorant receptor 10a-like n=1 Tax=Lutzomyia longipalpis TaxID=7200 RepID=UPI0024839F24|nr:odorant receptor 10a-like [Lutzomyia longipalpis]